ncbi:hypothetical protein OF83DRAFT_1174110 [Amylostereum chailletii]|nr:hypothetical protein OF83DRAFT_1174110 [Amylostereum chailletii]
MATQPQSSVHHSQTVLHLSPPTTILVWLKISPKIPPLVDAAQRQAYQRCLDFEAAASPTSKHAVPGATAIACEINQRADNRELHALGNMFKDFVLRCFKSYKEDNYPTPSPPSSDPQVQITNELLADPHMDHSTSKRIALIRDGGRCVLKNYIVDYNYYMSDNHPVPSLRDTDHISITQCAHIFPRATTMNLGDGDKDEYESTVVAIFERYGGVNIRPLLLGEDVHGLGNVMTMNTSTLVMFDSLGILLQPTDEDDTYSVCAGFERLLHGYPDKVTFRTTEHAGVILPKPDRKLLALHAACARVSYMSGAAEYIENVLRDMEETSVLANNGGSADLLQNALTRSIGSVVLAY